MTRDVRSSLDPWGRRGRNGLVTGLANLAYRHWFRVEWEGLQHLPASGGALLVANHAGILPVDGLILQYGIEEELGRPVYALGHDGFWRYPFVGTLLSRAGGVIGHPENAQRLLRDEKQLVVVFPEGSKGPVKPPAERYRLQRFGRGGFVETALRAGVPIVPISLMGTEDTAPIATTFHLFGQHAPLTWNILLLGPLLGAVAHLPAKIRVRVLEPIHFDEPPGLASYSHSLVMDAAEDIRGRMQASLDELLRARRSRWRG